MATVPKIIIPKNDLEKFKEKLGVNKQNKQSNTIYAGIPIIASENIPEGHYIIDNGTEMCIYYPDGKMIRIKGLTDYNELPKLINPKSGGDSDGN